MVGFLVFGTLTAALVAELYFLYKREEEDVEQECKCKCGCCHKEEENKEEE